MLELLEWGLIAVAIYYCIKILNSAWFDSLLIGISDLLEGISSLLPKSKQEKEKEEKEKEEELARKKKWKEENLKLNEKRANRSSYDLNEK